MGFMQARKLADTPFPFPHAQVVRPPPPSPTRPFPSPTRKWCARPPGPHAARDTPAGLARLDRIATLFTVTYSNM
eukprot:545802-Prorocentrum_minimum.AAC.2